MSCLSGHVGTLAVVRYRRNLTIHGLHGLIDTDVIILSFLHGLIDTDVIILSFLHGPVDKDVIILSFLRGLIDKDVIILSFLHGLIDTDVIILSFLHGLIGKDVIILSFHHGLSEWSRLPSRVLETWMNCRPVDTSDLRLVLQWPPYPTPDVLETGWSGGAASLTDVYL